MKTQLVEYRDNDSLLEGYLAYDDTRPEKPPLVLIAHAWSGRGSFEDGVAEALAEQGYAGFAMDNYGKGIKGGNNEENAKLMTPFMHDRSLLKKRLLAGLAAAQQLEMVDPSRIAAIGYCFGGLCVLDMARSGASIRGVVSFHGLFDPPADQSSEKMVASVLALHGQNDPLVPPDKVLGLETELTSAGVDWQIHVYGNSCHAFTNPAANDQENGMVYNPLSAGRAWTSMLNFLEEIFG